MVGRKPAIAPLTIIEAILEFKDRIVFKNDDGDQKIVPVTNFVWTEISSYLDWRISKNALHTFVQQGRHGVKEKLGITSEKCIPILNICETVSDHTVIDEFSDLSSGEDILPKKEFVITFSESEWNDIRPQEVVYSNNDKKRPFPKVRTYNVLPKKSWTPIIAEHFWIHTQLPCCLAFQRSKVYPSGSNYVVIVGRCTICASYFKGIIAEKPTENSRVLMHCVYIGNFDDVHKSVKKRRMVGPALENAVSYIVNEGLSAEFFREKEANHLMKPGNSEPPIIPTGRALRTLKWRHKQKNKRHTETLTALAMMKTEDDFKDVLHDMGVYPFFLHYHSGHQTHLYRSYCQHNKHPQLIIDATGSVVNNFKKFGTIKTQHIFLYEALVYDSVNMQSFTVTNMLSERHTNLAIFNWLAKWMSSDVTRPKETICDQSLALLSATVQCFTQYSSLQEYVNVCADMILGDLAVDSHWLPDCFVRIDVAHFIKLACKWTPLKSVPRRVKEVVLRTIGLIIKCQTINEMYTLLFSLFTVLTNETDGDDLQTGDETKCEKHKKHLIRATSTGFVNFEEQFNSILAAAETEEEARVIIEKEFELQLLGLDNYHNPFQSWAQEIFEKSKETLTEGTGINPMYLPSLVPHIIKCIKLLPLWSGLMVPIFGYGSITASSAAVESNFNKIKNITFKHITLPADIEVFLEQHTSSLRGASLLRRSQQNQQTENIIDSKGATKDKNDVINYLQKEIIITSCPLCKTGNLPSINGAHKCIKCNVPVHALLSCSTHLPGEETSRVCLKCSCDTIVTNYTEETNYSMEENTSVETWNRRPKSLQKSRSYLCPNSTIQHVRLNSSKNTQSLPILKNGSRANVLKSCRIENIGKVILSNTCAFDTIVSIFMISYSDSIEYCHEVDVSNNMFLKFVAGIVRNGITSKTYTNRAEILIEKLRPHLEEMKYGLMLASCDTTAGNLFDCLLCDLPSAFETTICDNEICVRNKNSPTPVTILMYSTDKGELNGLQTFLDSRQETDITECGFLSNDNIACKGQRTTTVNISYMHLCIEILNWEGESHNYSTEALPQLEIELMNIPEVLISSNKTYQLRGVGCFRRGHSRLRSSIGHYYAYCKRGPHHWEIFDDLQKKPKAVRETTKVPCEFLIYTI